MVSALELHISEVKISPHDHQSNTGTSQSQTHNQKTNRNVLVHYNTRFAQKPHRNSSSLETLNLRSPNVAQALQLLRNWISSTLQASPSVGITLKPDGTKLPATATNYMNSKHRLTGTHPEGLKSRKQHYSYYCRG
jgi:hypothetical protein